MYSNKFKSGSLIFNEIRKLHESGKPFQFIVLRKNSQGKTAFSTNIKTVFSELKFKEDAGNGFDISVDVKLIQYRDYSIKKVKTSDKTITAATPVRSATSAPVPPKTYTVVKGDSLWMIAHRFMGNGSRYKELYNLNKAVIDAGNKGTGNPVYTIYPRQVFVLP
ncbi:MAG: LysM peptidoglycan-binding domain-containing protein [Oscillospiraceae bacterium]|nr:LysM peptidoglycan-binding domain-containing protein [Oscillospiraceae bacterium]